MFVGIVKLYFRKKEKSDDTIRYGLIIHCLMEIIKNEYREGVALSIPVLNRFIRNDR